MNIFIIHGAYGNPEENWFPWLKKELESHTVFVPRFPTPEDQTLDNWMDVFKEYIDKIDGETIFVGHSLGPAFILSVLEKLNVQVKASFFVSGFTGLLGNPQFDEINKTFVDKDFDWEKIKNNCKQFYLFHSDNDPYVPLEKGKELGEKVDSEIILIEGAGHFNTQAGFTKFPQLLELIKKELD